ncbi:hypothetical protein CTZ27_37110 [Streptomyces griseocarneus]|nr:hypothetical protein CTZ27_37110 [Streptomyces griseocarneus]
MTGPEHYREAERLVRLASRHTESSDALVLVTAAQVHATLALASATALTDAGGEGGMPIVDYNAWADASSGLKRGEGE